MSDQEYSGSQQRRKHFRIQFPFEHHPILTIQGRKFIVLDVSEGGIRFYNPYGVRMPEDLFSAMISFRTGDEVQVVGRIIRRQRDYTVMGLVRGIPSKVVLAQQAYLRRVAR